MIVPISGVFRCKSNWIRFRTRQWAVELISLPVRFVSARTGSNKIAFPSDDERVGIKPHGELAERQN
jgi:hypothetical protein